MRSIRLRQLLFIVLTTAGASSISLIGGVGIEAVQEHILPLVPLIIALPALNTMVGDYAAIIAAHASDPAERIATKRTLAKAVAKAIWVNIIGVLLLSTIIAMQRGYLFTGIFLTKFAAFVILSMLGTVFAMLVITVILDKLLERKRLNPDDILIPIVTSVTDVLMLGLIAVAAWTLF